MSSHLSLSELIAQLHCPYCGDRLAVEQLATERETGDAYGTMRCACHRYPIVSGIPILRQHPGFTGVADPTVARIDRGDLAGALEEAVFSASPIPPERIRPTGIRRVFTRWTGHPAEVASREAVKLTDLRTALNAYRPTAYADYLYYRHANVSFLAAVPLLLLLGDLVTPSRPRPVILDLNCGVGHATFLVSSLFPAASVIATDHDFVNLFLAKRFFARSAVFICLDAEFPLPFDSHGLDAVVCLDGLHYIRSKRALVAELDRSVAPDGIWLFPHLHNANQPNVAAGIPLAPSAYRDCFDFLPSRLLVETQVLRGFVNTGTGDFAEGPTDAALDSAPTLSLVASRRSHVLARREDLVERLVAIRTGLGLNPIYREDGRRDGKAHLHMRWPSRQLEDECVAVKEVLPERVAVNASLLDRVRAGDIDGKDADAIASLSRTFVFVHLPGAYAA